MVKMVMGRRIGVYLIKHRGAACLRSSRFRKRRQRRGQQHVDVRVRVIGVMLWAALPAFIKGCQIDAALSATRLGCQAPYILFALTFCPEFCRHFILYKNTF